MTSTFTGAAMAQRPQRLFLIPIGQENTHQRTIDGLLPADVVPSASTSALLPCWGVTDGNYLAKNKVRAQAGDVFALIRARRKGQPAYVHRLAVVENLVRDPSACAELYKLSHDYNMGGRKVSSVPFTWIIKFKAVVPVKWDKQAFLAKLGIPAYDPILSARLAVLAHQKNAAQAAQVLQECNAVLGLPSNMQQSSGSGPSPPATMLQSNSCGHNSHEGAPVTSNGNSKTAHTPKAVSKRPHPQLPDSEGIAQQQTALPPKRSKYMLSPASTDQHVNDKDPALTDLQTDRSQDHGLHIRQQHLEHTHHAGSHHRPCKASHVMSRKLKYQALTTEELQGKLGRLRWVLQTCVNSLGDGGLKIMAECHQVEDELECRMAEEQSKQQGSSPDHSSRLADPGSPNAPDPAQPACRGNSTGGLSGHGPQVQDVTMVEPQSETQAVSFAQAQSIQSEAEEASQALSGRVQAPVQDSHHAGVIAAPAAITYAQQSIIAGLIYHFAATKGPSWLAQ